MFARTIVSVPSAVGPQSAKRFLNLQEFQSKKLMDQYGVRTQKWIVGSSRDEIVTKASQNLKSPEYVVKAMVLAGGRGKGTFSNKFKGGVHLCESYEDAGDLADKMLGFNLVTKQTSEEGVPVNSVMVAEAIDLKRELYVSIVLDRAVGGPAFVYSPKGGVDIEEVAATDPKSIFTESIDITTGPTPEQLSTIAKNLQFEGPLIEDACNQLAGLYKLFISLDATQVEINPFAETPQGSIYAADAKISFDDNAAFRQKEVFDLHDPELDEPKEAEASKYGLNYIAMEGSIGCMVNGAGLAMATMDIIKHYGGEPANFLDVGGNANEDQVTKAFQIITSDPQVKTILVNIFGGIMKCDVIARGVIAAAKNLNLTIPLVVRLEGTNVEEGKKLLQESGLTIITADDLDDAAQKAIKAMNEAEEAKAAKVTGEKVAEE